MSRREIGNSVLYPRKIVLIVIVFYVLLIVVADYLGFLNNIPKEDISYFVPRKIKLKGLIVSQPRKKKNKTVFIFKVKEIINENCNVSGKILVNCYFPRVDFVWGDEIEVTGMLSCPYSALNPGEFDYKKYLSRKKIYALLQVNGYNNIKLLTSGKRNFIFTASSFLRKEMKKRIEQYTKRYSWRVLSGIMLGERNILPGEIYQDFIVSGIVHILAVSGLHVGLVLFIFLGIFSLLGLPKKSTYLLTIIMIFFYVQMTGARPSAVRAFLMAALGLGAYFFGRDRNLHHSLYLSALIILLVNPRTLFSIGFQFSYLATIGILCLSGLIRKLLTPLPVWLRNAVSVSLGAQIMIYPLIAYYFNQISLIAPLANLFVVPLVGIIVTLGFSTCLISLVSGFLATVIGGVNSLCILFLIKEAEFFASFPLASVKVSTPSVLFLVVFYLIIFCLINYKIAGKFYKNSSFLKFRYFFLSGGIIISLIFIINSSFFRSAYLKITFLALRKGNSIFLEFPDGKNMLIGVGGTSKAAERVLVPFLLSKRVKKINTVVIMRDNPIHTKGLGTILNNFKIKEMVFNSKLGSWDIPFKIKKVKSGDWIKKQKEFGLHVLNPEFFRNNRNDSLVLYLVYKDFSILFTGDIGKRAQKRIVNNYGLKVKIIQIPDQKGGGILENFLWEIFPECAIITFSGKAKINFLRQLDQIISEKKETLKIYSTKEMGALEITTCGKTYEIKGYRDIKGQ